ncbi:meiotic W68 [Haematobia irritans]|uniref:meiotic W68 n=1 Tax=Haematobia irritans TaxID=7368 RepID=UPI003F50967E
MINSIESLINSLLRDLILKGPNTEIHIKNNNMVTVGHDNNGDDDDDDDGGDDNDDNVIAAANPVQEELTQRGQGRRRRQKRSNATTYRCLNNLPTDVLPNNEPIDEEEEEQEVHERLVYGHRGHRQRIAMLIFTLAETHDLLLNRSSCTYRELFYKNTHMTCTTVQVNKAVKDVCSLLGQTSWNLGIFSSGKGMIAGPLTIVMSNGDLIDCNSFSTPTMIPPNFTYIDHFQTNAQLILIVEKDTMFKRLLQSSLSSIMNGHLLLVTARGSPDIATRWLLHNLTRQYNHIATYMLADGDPYGIEIMLTYRYGSLNFSQYASMLSCPHMKWLGIHPSDIIYNGQIPQEPLTANDYRKIESLLKRSYVPEEIRRELMILQQHRFKVKLDNMSGQTFSLFIYDYIVNKIKRQVVL